MARLANKAAALITMLAVAVQLSAPSPVIAKNPDVGVEQEEQGCGGGFRHGTISGYKFYDADDDGEISGHDTVAGWTIELSGGYPGYARTTTTDANGYYVFNDLALGTYQIAEKSPSGEIFKQTYPIDPEFPDQASNYFITVTRQSSEFTDISFGNYLPKCGNGYIDEWAGEDCEGTLFNSCQIDGRDGVTTCDAATCKWGPCEPVVCGDGSVSGNERCDSESRTCTVYGYAGTQTCNGTCDGWNACQVDGSCGDGVVNGSETCDGSAPVACTTELGYNGSITCDNCQLSACQTGEYCGDATVNGDEMCEPGQTQSCTADNGYTGTQSCNVDCSGWGACVTQESCGDGAVNGAEVCDGGSQSCTVNGYAGTQACNGTCSGWDACFTVDSCGDNVKRTAQKNATAWTGFRSINAVRLAN